MGGGKSICSIDFSAYFPNTTDTPKPLCCCPLLND